MLFTQGMKDLLGLFNKHNVQYALVGGFAVNYYGYVRTTQDIDFLVCPPPENAERVTAALKEFGFGQADIPREYFKRAGSAIHLGVEPNRIDLLTQLRGISNERLLENAQQVILEDVPVCIVSLNDLLEVKRCSKRLKDQADAEELRNRNNRDLQ